MLNRRVFALGLPALLAACGGGPVPVDQDGNPLRRLYRIRPGQMGDIQFRMLDGLNALRGAQGRANLALSAELNAAAETHSRDMLR
ncbi:MAG: CAP domain-containing protein, partial [Pseudomonadota bacterium]